MEPEFTRRRKFLNYLLGTSTGATLVAIFYPVIKFVIPPQVIEATQNSVVAGKLNEFAVNSGKIIKFGNKPVILIRTPTGDLKALSAVCTHLDCIVQYQPEAKGIWCACHNGRYNLNGQNISGPPPRPLEEYTVNVRGDDVIISKA
ncbi:MAG: ubiquinol-cytochrome c reductase iron-sulfur subunit [Acidobacteria bacterium]|nr:ubiquinol-cytochrome c reductase iron-sulfur subunit [Acidobacteriota bacterium]MBI3422611.1 ubiquinol-cytochrome c reductase iron-sulfur subunit [Acidobacteriota bacterium]